MADAPTPLLDEVAQYYSSKLATHGACARGVDWNGEEGQNLRFEQLCRVFQPSRPLSVNDLGCGYGALWDYLRPGADDIFYVGVDVSADMVEAAVRRFPGESRARFLHAERPDAEADYGIASGVFNVRLGRTDEEWRRHFEDTLDLLDATSRKGFSFNCLTSYSDKDRMRGDLYYADPCALFDLCKRRYSRNVALLHDYQLYEFTILVRKTP